MRKAPKIRFVEPRGRPGRPFNAWIRRWPLLGPVILATILDQRGFDARIYNENISGPVDQDSEALEDLCSADVVGISIMTPTAHRGYALADLLRAEGSHATIVFGGVHATFLPNEALGYGDVVVRGEGESVIEALARGDIRKGIVDAAPVEDMDSLPTLDYSLMRDFDKLVAEFRRRDLYVLPVSTSRGCPYGCTYCSVTRMFGHKVRRQSVEKVYADLRAYTSQGFRRIFFYDDNFLSDRAWARRLLDRLMPLKLRFNAQARADFYWQDRARGTCDEALLQALRRSGGDVLYVGYETIDDATARDWNKGYRGTEALETRLAEDTHMLHESGFCVHGMFVLGPHHTRRTADGIVRFARDNQIESIQISILTPLPGTPMMDQMRPHLVLSNFPSDWDFFDGAHCVYNHGQLSIDRLQQVVLDAHRHFYRCGGWNFRRARAMLGEHLNIRDKLAMIWDNARTARQTLRDWQAEAANYLEYAKTQLTT